MADLVSMELSDDEKLDACMPIPCDRPDYPWGLRISLTHDDLARLGLDAEDARIGGVFTFTAKAKITSVSMSEDIDRGMNARHSRVEAQITAMDVDEAIED